MLYSYRVKNKKKIQHNINCELHMYHLNIITLQWAVIEIKCVIGGLVVVAVNYDDEVEGADDNRTGPRRCKCRGHWCLTVSRCWNFSMSWGTGLCVASQPPDLPCPPHTSAASAPTPPHGEVLERLIFIKHSGLNVVQSEDVVIEAAEASHSLLAVSGQVRSELVDTHHEDSRGVGTAAVAVLGQTGAQALHEAARHPHRASAGVQSLPSLGQQVELEAGREILSKVGQST